MAAVPIVIIGTMKDNDSGEEKQVTITGLAGLQGYAPGHPLPPPLGIWGGSNEPFPGWGLPPAGPGKPPGMWGGSNEPFPGWGLPKPPDGGPAPEPKFEWKVGWTASTGWIVVAVPQFPHPTPSS